MPEGTTAAEWRGVLHADSDGLDQARLMINLTDVFFRQDTDDTTGLTEEEKVLLMKAMASQNWGKSNDISYEFITTDDVESRVKKFHEVYSELVPEADPKERFIVEHAIYDKSSKLGKVFDAVRRLNCLRTGLIAYREFKQNPNQKEYEQLGALSIGVLANQLVPLIGYAEEYAPVKAALTATTDEIDAIFDDPAVRHSPFIDTQQTLDSIDRARMIWERSYDGGGATQPATKRHETIFSEGSAFDKRLINDKAELERVITGLKNIGLQVVLTSGSFDLLHIGHAAYIEKASEFGDMLVVGVDSDAKIKKRKGDTRPIVPETERIKLLSHVRGVGIITVKDPDEERWGLIKLVRPDTLVVTAETYQPDEIRELEEKYCGRVVVLEPQATSSTSAQIRKIEIGAAKRDGERIAQAIGSRIAVIMGSDLPDAEKLVAIERIFTSDKTA